VNRNDYYSDLWRERMTDARAYFGDRVFSVYEVAYVWGVSANHAFGALAFYELVGAVKKVVYAARDGNTYCVYGENGELVEKRLPSLYSFDFSKTPDDALDLYDPIPISRRSLAPQLFGNVRARYELLHEEKLAATLNYTENTFYDGY